MNKVRSSAFRWLLWIGLLVGLPTLGNATTYVHPNRLDLGFSALNVSIELGDYTNCVAYYTAEVPTFGTGTADFIIPDLSPQKNDGEQANTDYQPVVALVGERAWFHFDGVDDSVTGANILVSELNNTIDLSLDFRWDGGGGGHQLLGGYGRDPWEGAGRGAFLMLIGPTFYGAVFTDEANTSVSFSGIDPNRTYSARLLFDGYKVRLYLDGVLVSSASNTGSLVQSSVPAFRVGANNTQGYPFSGYISNIKFK